MTQERWLEIVDTIEERFTPVVRSRETLNDGSKGTKDCLEFTCPLGYIKLECITKPRVVGEQALYSNRIGSEVAVKKQYDAHDIVCFLKAFKQESSGTWHEIDISHFFAT